MLKKVRVESNGDTDLLPGQLVDRSCYERENAEEKQGRAGDVRAADPRHHQGVARDRVVPLGRLLPGDDQGADRRLDRGQDRPAARAEGERDHREADPGGHRPQALPGDRDRPGRADRARGLRAGHAPAGARGDRPGRRLGRDFGSLGLTFGGEPGSERPTATTPARPRRSRRSTARSTTRSEDWSPRPSTSSRPGHPRLASVFRQSDRCLRSSLLGGRQVHRLGRRRLGRLLRDTLGFELERQFGPNMAIVSPGDATYGSPVPARRRPSRCRTARRPEPGGWSRLVLRVAGLDELVAALEARRRRLPQRDHQRARRPADPGRGSFRELHRTVRAGLTVPGTIGAGQRTSHLGYFGRRRPRRAARSFASLRAACRSGSERRFSTM